MSENLEHHHIRESEDHPELEGRPELVKKRARYLAANRFIAITLILFCTVSLSILVFNAVQSLQTRHVLVDCTNPQGECAKEGQARTAVLIQQLIHEIRNGNKQTQDVVVAGLICAADPSNVTLIEFKACVEKQLVKVKKVGVGNG